jgi:hypothetical protein
VTHEDRAELIEIGRLVSRIVAADLMVTIWSSDDKRELVYCRIGEGSPAVSATVRLALVLALVALRDETGLDVLAQEPR